ncbi:MAG TPA: SRPBCC family protein, partial [Pilimelia sp.]|nr:SRPBCC family protein [Pilimelia sp.]
MSTVAVSDVIDAAPALVWALLTDVPGRGRWLSTVDSVDVVTPGVFRTGTVWRETRAMGDGGFVTEEFQVRECEAPRRFVVSSPGSGADYRMTYTLAPVEVGRHRGGTTVTVEQEGHASGTTGRVLEMV